MSHSAFLLLSIRNEFEKLRVGGDRIAKKSSGQRNAPSKTGKPSGKGRSNKAPKK
jgi:hypothetical protein